MVDFSERMGHSEVFPARQPKGVRGGRVHTNMDCVVPMSFE